jgi:NAD(P)H-dependent FMN reductase
MRTAAGVDVFSDNASHVAVLPSTTPPQHHERRIQPRTQEHRKARLIVRDDIDTIDDCPDHRVMQKPNWRRIYQCEKESAGHDRDDGWCARRSPLTGTTVLAIRIPTIAISRELAHAAALSSPNGITLNVFDGLAYLPSYCEALENQPLPRAAAALRKAASDAHAAIILTHYYGYIPAIVHNAIDWLTRRSNHSALHDKPLAVIGPTEDGYSGVWSRHHTEKSRHIAGARVIEPITVTTLHEAVTKLAEQANITTQPPSPIPVFNPHR